MVTVAWYIRFFRRQLPPRGHSFLPQLQVFSFSWVSFESNLELWEEMSFAILGVHLYDILTVFLLIILLKGFDFGKYGISSGVQDMRHSWL